MLYKYSEAKNIIHTKTIEIEPFIKVKKFTVVKNNSDKIESVLTQGKKVFILFTKNDCTVCLEKASELYNRMKTNNVKYILAKNEDSKYGLNLDVIPDEYYLLKEIKTDHEFNIQDTPLLIIVDEFNNVLFNKRINSIIDDDKLFWARMNAVMK